MQMLAVAHAQPWDLTFHARDGLDTRANNLPHTLDLAEAGSTYTDDDGSLSFSNEEYDAATSTWHGQLLLAEGSEEGENADITGYNVTLTFDETSKTNTDGSWTRLFADNTTSVNDLDYGFYIAEPLNQWNLKYSTNGRDERDLNLRHGIHFFSNGSFVTGQLAFGEHRFFSNEAFNETSLVWTADLAPAAGETWREAGWGIASYSWEIHFADHFGGNIAGSTWTTVNSDGTSNTRNLVEGYYTLENVEYDWPEPDDGTSNKGGNGKGKRKWKSTRSTLDSHWGGRGGNKKDRSGESKFLEYFNFAISSETPSFLPLDDCNSVCSAVATNCCASVSMTTRKGATYTYEYICINSDIVDNFSYTNLGGFSFSMTCAV